MRRALALGLLAAFLVAAPVRAQESGELELRIDAVDDSAYPNVVLTVTVPAEMNGLALTPENFFVSEDGRTIDIGVEQLPVEELAVALLMDTSGSMSGAPLAAAKEAVVGFVEAMPDGVELALLRFGNTAELVVPFSADRDPILSGVNSLAAGGETALYDGLIAAANSFGDEGARRTIVLLTDGGDTVSTADLQDSLVDLINSGARLVMVELESPESDRTTLNRLEAATGGALVPASDPDALQGIYSEVASDLINQYRLTYQSTAEGPTDIVAAVRFDDFAAVGTASAVYPTPDPVTTSVTSTTGVPPSTTLPIEAAVVPADVKVPWFATTTGLMVGAASIFTAMTLVLLLLIPSRRRAMGALSSIAALAGRDAKRGRFSELTSRATLFAEDTLNRGENGSALRTRLDQAGLRLREGEAVLLALTGALVAFAAGFLFIDILVGILFAGLVLFGSWSVLKWLGKRRADKFRAQLPETLQLISGSLRAGFGLNQALTAVAGEQDAPASEEFARAQLEVHLGKDVEDALRTMAVRTQSEDLPWVAEAIEIHREIGGDVADLLDQIAATVRERERIRGQIAVLSAEGKVSGIVLVALPFVIAGLTFSVAPDYIGELTGTNPGRVMLALGSGAMLTGIFWIRRIVTLEF